jgi:hypothetical protein
MAEGERVGELYNTLFKLAYRSFKDDIGEIGEMLLSAKDFIPFFLVQII